MFHCQGTAVARLLAAADVRVPLRSAGRQLRHREDVSSLFRTRNRHLQVAPGQAVELYLSCANLN